MKRFIIRFNLFITPILCVIALLYIFPNDVEKKQGFLSEIKPEDKCFFIMGDSKSLTGIYYDTIKKYFPEYEIYNISNWAKNPCYNHSAFKENLHKSDLRNSIIFYNLTFRHVLNRGSENYEKTMLSTQKVKDLLKMAINRSYNFDYERGNNGFIYMLGTNWGEKTNGEEFYKELQNKYTNDYSFQLNYVDSIKKMVEGNNNLFFIGELPYTSSLDSIYNNTVYYEGYREAYKSRYPESISFGKFVTDIGWYNRDHLNIVGSQEFTPVFCDSIKSKILNCKPTNISADGL